MVLLLLWTVQAIFENVQIVTVTFIITTLPLPDIKMEMRHFRQPARDRSLFATSRGSNSPTPLPSPLAFCRSFQYVNNRKNPLRISSSCLYESFVLRPLLTLVTHKLFCNPPKKYTSVLLPNIFSLIKVVTDVTLWKSWKYKALLLSCYFRVLWRQQA